MNVTNRETRYNGSQATKISESSIISEKATHSNNNTY